MARLLGALFGLIVHGFLLGVGVFGAIALLEMVAGQ